MSLILDKAPVLILTGNPAEISFRKKGILSTTSGYPYLLLALDTGSLPADSDTLVLDFGDGSNIIFTFSNAPGDDAGSIIAWTGSGTTWQYARSLANDIYRHPYINQNFYVDLVAFSQDDNIAIIRILSRNRGNDYNISIDNSSTLTYDTEHTTSKTYEADDNTLSDYILNARVSIIKDFNTNPCQTDIDDIEASGFADADTDEMKVTFHDVPDLVKEHLGVDIPDNPLLPFFARKSAAMVLMEVTEQYDTGFQFEENVLQNTEVYKKSSIQAFNDFDSSDTIAVPFMALAAGGSLDKFPYPDNLQAWLTANPVPFLSLQPNRKKLITTDEPEWLSFLLPSGTGTFHPQFIVQYSDGSTGTGNGSSLSCLTSQGQVAIFPTGWIQCNLGNITPAKTPVSYTVKIVNSSAQPVSETFTYILDTRYFRDTRYFIYQNSLGQIDTLRCVGVNKYSIARKTDTSNKVLDDWARAAKGAIEMVYNELEETWTMRTGWLLSRDEKDFLTDFLRSNYVAEVIMPLVTAGGNGALPGLPYYKQPYRSVIVQQDSIDMWQMDDGTWGLEWKMSYANKENYYSNILTAPEYWYDTYFDFTAEVTAVSGEEGTLTIGIGSDNAFYTVEVNGVDVSSQVYDSGAYQITATGIYHIRIKASTCVLVGITSRNLTWNLTITKIESPSLQEIFIANFQTLNDDYLCNRIENLYTLQTFTINPATNPGFNIDKMLSSVSKLYSKGLDQLNTIDFSGSTPSVAGALIAEYLTEQEVSVTTG